MKRSFFNSLNIKLLFAYLLFTYIIQIFLYHFVSDDPVIWNVGSLSIEFYVSLIVFICVYILINFVAFNNSEQGNNLLIVLLRVVCKKLGSLVSFLWFKVRKWHVLFFFISGIFWLREGLSTYRYDTINIGDKLSLELVAGMLWKIFFYMDFWYHVTLSFVLNKKVEYKYKYLINISFLFFISGTTSAIYFIINSLFVYFPKTFLNIMYLSFSKILFKVNYNLFKIPIITFCLMFLFMYAYHVGEIVKTGNDISLTERFESEESQEFIKHFFIQRFSTTLYAHTYLMESVHYETGDYMDNINIPIDNFFYRLNILFGKPFEVEKPKIASINRLNYNVLLAFGHDNTSGASPGLIPGFMYLFPIWLALLLSVLVLTSFASVISFSLKKSTFIYAAITMFLLLDLFKAIVVSLNPISTTFFQIIFFFGLTGVLLNKTKQYKTA